MEVYLPLSIVLLTLAVYQSKGCQEPWELHSKSLSYGSVIGFKNVTTIGKQELLSWSWPGENQELWELSMLRSFEEKKAEGKITYRKLYHSQKIVVTIQWAISGKEISSMSSNKRIISKPWTLSICNGINIDFASDKTGFWQFKIDEFVLQRNSEEIDRYSYLERRKRAEEFEVTEYYVTTLNDTQQSKGVLDSIYDYFFGEEDTVAGRSAGIFVQVKNWMKDVTCRLKGSCEEHYPYPIPTYPPVQPEGVTVVNADNDVF